MTRTMDRARINVYRPRQGSAGTFCKNPVATLQHSAGAIRPSAQSARHRRPMLNAMSVFSRTVDERVGWNRIGAVISVVVIAASLVVLYRLLHDIELAKITVAL